MSDSYTGTGGKFERLEQWWEQLPDAGAKVEPARECQVTLTDAQNIVAALSLYISEMEGVLSETALLGYRATELQYKMLVNDMHKYGKEVRYE